MSAKEDPDDILEEALYDLLDQALRRAECAARATARVEYDIVQTHMEQQEPPTTDPDEIEGDEQELAQQSSREFNSAQFQSTFTNLNMLRIVSELIDIMGLDHLEEPILHTLVSSMFRPRGPSAPARSGEGETFVGTDADLLYHKLRQMAESKQRGRR